MTGDGKSHLIRDLALKGHSPAEIAHATGMALHRVKGRITSLRQAGIPIPPTAPAPSFMVRAAAALQATGLSRDDMADALDVSTARVNNLLDRAERDGLLTADQTPIQQVRLSQLMIRQFDRAGRRRQTTSADIALRILTACAAEPALIDNVLDDGAAE